MLPLLPGSPPMDSPSDPYSPANTDSIIEVVSPPELPISDSVSLADTSSHYDDKGWDKYLHRAVNAQTWSLFVANLYSITTLVDPLCFFIIKPKQDKRCVTVNKTSATFFILYRTVVDLLLIVNILLQFCLTYKYRVTGAGPRKNAFYYFRREFLGDLIILFPLLQIWMYLLQKILDSPNTSGSNFFYIILIFPYIPKLWRVRKLFATIVSRLLPVHSPILTQCLQDICQKSDSECGCFKEDGYSYGLCKRAVTLSTKSDSTVNIHAFFWGIQQISTVAGNLDPGEGFLEKNFCVVIQLLGLSLFPFIVANALSYLQNLKQWTVKQLTSQEQRKSDGHLALKDNLTESVTDAERIALVSDEVFQPEAVWKLLDIQIICATMEFSTATVTLADADGKEHCACSRGTCPVKSAFKAVDLIVKEPTTLLEYSMDTATEGTDAIATTRVLVHGNALTGEEVQRNFSGTAARMNVVVSAVEAYMEALNKMLDFKEKFLLETSKSLPE